MKALAPVHELFKIEPAEPYEFTVSEISKLVKELLESNLGYVRVKGEISGLKIAASGHGYFNLKDNLTVLGCTCWRPVLAKIKFPLSDGMEVVVAGKISSYAGQSRYQLSVERIEPAGIGAMMQILKERRQVLEKEGLFEIANKKPLPFLPRRIGVVTSITGAVIKDIIHRLIDRCPTNVVIWPVTVQGEGAAAEITNAIEGFNKLAPEFRPDVIIVARGGGSIEDLWPFNEEIVVRAVHASHIPIISAVGHETDYTLIDFVADVRAPTPTAAAEFAVPVAANLLYTLNSHYTRLLGRLSQVLKHHAQVLNNFDRILKYPMNYVESWQQRIDELGFRLLGSLPNLVKQKTLNVEVYSINRLLPTKIMHYKSLQVTHAASSLVSLSGKALNIFEHKLHLSSALLTSLDYNNVLKRGFAMVKSADGKLVSSVAKIPSHDQFNLLFSDGSVSVKVSPFLKGN